MSNEKKFYEFGIIHQPRLYKSEDLARGVGKLLVELDSIYIGTVSKIKAIQSSGTFTAKGKREAITELSVEVVRLISDWKRVINGYETQIGQLEREMQPKRIRRDDVVGEMRQREVRDYLRTLDPINLEARFMAAAREGDELFLAAIEESLIPFTFSTNDLIEKVRFQRLSVAYPAQSTKVADLQVGSQSASSALATVRNER